MISRDKLEGYLMKLALSFHEAGPGTWVVSDREKGLENLLVQLVRAAGDPPHPGHGGAAAGREQLFEELLKLNATDMIHGAYAVDGKNVLIIDTLEAETMDLEEFKASIDAIGLALAQHYRLLSRYRAKK